ncbi:MAG TPA: hypothetical protein VLG47_03965 [Candidatus Saccharimonadales bacterium]|nr:hypothetical protein [Candidatus Saccharimonadales bacterium]
MIDICPTIDVEDTESFQIQMERAAKFAHRVHIDLGDGVFTPNMLVPINDIWWPGGVRADLHLMYKKPLQHLNELIALSPQLIIVHAEAEGDFRSFAETVHHHGIEIGIALLQQTPAETIQPALEFTDHVLIFSGNLGYQGGSTADMSLLNKIKFIKSIKPSIEIGWDGGVNDKNIRDLIAGGVEVANVGGYIQHSDDPTKAYERLQAAAVLSDTGELQQDSVQS